MASDTPASLAPLASLGMTGIPGDQIGALMHQVVPMVATLGLEYGEVTPQRAVVVLRDQPEYRNHVGGPHAAAMFAAGESATGAAALAAFGDMMDRAVLLPVTATMDYLAIARGDITAVARVDGDIEAARRTFDEGTRPEVEITCELTDGAGTVTGRLSTHWTLKALKRD
jgi:acyl-coenzyme A thioesterase PaaI-like protein